MIRILLAAILLSAASVFAGTTELLHTFKKVRVTDQFWAEGAAIGDFNHDGKMDVVSGAYWYEGPGFQEAPRNLSRQRQLQTQERPTAWNKPSLASRAHWVSTTLTRIASSPSPTTSTATAGRTFWCMASPARKSPGTRTRKNRPGHWQRHVIFDVLDNESPGFVDITGDGKPEILCCSGGYIGYAEADWKNPAAPWKFHPISPKGDYQRFTHGIGCRRHQRRWPH